MTHSIRIIAGLVAALVTSILVTIVPIIRRIGA